MAFRGMSIQISSSNVTNATTPGTPSVHFRETGEDRDLEPMPEEGSHTHGGPHHLQTPHHNHHPHHHFHRRESLYYRSGELDDERDPEDVKNLRPIPTTVVPIYRQRMVLVKIAGNFLRIGSGSNPILSKLKLPLRPPVNDDLLDYLEEIDNAKKKKAKKSARPQFMYQDFTFMADESASITESWYRQARAFFHVRLGIQRGQSTEDIEYLCAIRTPNDQYEVIFDKHTFGSWWRITALSFNTYVAESVQFPGRCLTKGVFGVALSPPLTQRERAGISCGNMDEGRTITIYTLPDFAVWHPGVCIN